MTVQDTDTFLVNRSGTSYRVPASDFKTIGVDPWQTTAPPNATNGWEDIIFDGSQFVAVASSGNQRVIYSTDGESWSDAGGPASLAMRTIIYGNGVYVVARGNGENLYYSQSSTFNSWASAYGSFDAPDDPIYGGCYGGPNNYYLLVGGGNYYGRSTNGQGWSELAKPTNDTWWNIAYGNGYYVAIQQSSIWYSSSADAGSWTQVTVGTCNWKGIAFNGTRFVLVGDSSTNRIAYATDVTSWTVIASPDESSLWRGVTYGDGKFVAVAGGNTTPTSRLMSSTDGINWSLEDFSVYNSWNKIAYGNDTFVSIASSGSGDQRVLYSAETSPLVEGDICLVNRNNVSYKCDITNLKAKVQDNDLLLANRSNVSYKVTGAVFKEDIFGPDVTKIFNVTTYPGTGSTQSLTTGIDLQNNDGFLWFKALLIGYNNQLYDTLNGVTKKLLSDSNASQANSDSTELTSFNSDGFTIGSSDLVNQNGGEFIAYSFMKKAQFFDVVQYTGDGVSGRSIPHNLGSKPGCIFIKKLTVYEDWVAQHVGSPYGGNLNKNTSFQLYSDGLNVTTTDFVVSNSNKVNEAGYTYIAYVWAEDTPNLIKCGSYQGSGASGNTITLGWEPQYVWVKAVTTSGSWHCLSSAVSRTVDFDNATAASSTVHMELLSNGFKQNNTLNDYNGNNQTYIYMAIAAP